MKSNVHRLIRKIIQGSEIQLIFSRYSSIDNYAVKQLSSSAVLIIRHGKICSPFYIINEIKCTIDE